MYKLLDVQVFNRLYPNFNTKLPDGSKMLIDDAIELLYDTMHKFEIDTKMRQAYFIAQCAQETMGFFRYEENIRYSAARLIAIFPNRFTLDTAKKCALNPALTANTVYASRYGNGDFDSGDGYRYRGRGMTQVTFKDNYNTLDNSDNLLSDNYAEKPELVSFLVGAMESACHFWMRKKLNASADIGRLDVNTRVIHGDITDLHKRQIELGRIYQFAQ